MFEDFDINECEAMLSGVKPRISAYHLKFTSYAGNENITESMRRAYTALYNACSLFLKPESLENPLAPFLVFADGRTSFTIDRFQDDELLFFEEILPSLHDSILVARLADILWIRRKNNAYSWAMKAISAYLNAPLSFDNWYKDDHDDYWERGVRLAKQLGKVTESFHGKSIVEHLASLFADAPTGNPRYLLFLIKLQIITQQHETHGQKEILCNKIDAEAILQHDKRNFEDERDLLDAMLTLRKGNADIISRIALAYEEEIQDKRSNFESNHLWVQMLCNQLIHCLQLIPLSQRHLYNVSGRLDIARKTIEECHKYSTRSMHVIKSPPIDITAVVQNSINQVKDLTFHEAVQRFAAIYTIQESDLRQTAVEIIHDHPLLYLFQRNTIASDGRIVATTNGLFSASSSQMNDETINAATMDQYIQHLRITAKAIIWPAYSTLLNDHHISFSDSVNIVKSSYIIPPDRILVFAKILDFGFHGDFLTASYLLASEIENLIRFHLKLWNVTTTTIDKDGTEQEIGMSSLLERPEVAQCFGEHYAWELNALFCDKRGPNLRNNFAHGLSTIELGQSDFALYAWWLALQMIVLLSPKNSDNTPFLLDHAATITDNKKP